MMAIVAVSAYPLRNIQMDRSNELAQALSKALKYTKTLKLNVGMQPLQQSSQTILSHDSHYDHPLSAFHKAKASGPVSRDSSPRRQKRNKDTDPFNLSYKHPVLKKDFQSQHERDVAFNRTSDKVQIKHLGSLLGPGPASRQLGASVGAIGKKGGHSYTYTHLNDDSDKFSDADNTFFRPQAHKPKFRHSKSPSKERHMEHNNTSYAQEDRGHAVLRMGSRGDAEMGVLLLEIERLQNVIQEYQGVLLKLKQRCLQLERQVQEKALNDHFIDVLKQQLENTQEQNQRLKYTIHSQRNSISQFELIIQQRISQVTKNFEKETQQGLQLARENDFLKRLLMIATNNPETHSCKGKEQNSKEKQLSATAKLSDNAQAPSSSAFLRSIAKNAQQLAAKWK